MGSEEKARGDFWQFVFFSMAASVRLGYLSLDVFSAEELSEKGVLAKVIRGGIESGALMTGEIPWAVVVQEAKVWGVDADEILAEHDVQMAEYLAANRRALGGGSA